MTIIHLGYDPRTPEEREIDEEVYNLAEAGKFFRDFKPPKPRKPAKRKRTGEPEAVARGRGAVAR